MVYSLGDTVYHGREVMAGARGSWSHFTCSQETERDAGTQLLLFSFLLSSGPQPLEATFRGHFAILVNPI